MKYLDVEYFSQQSNAIRNDCGPACCAMLINSYTDQVVTIEDYYNDLDILPGGLQAVWDLRKFLSEFGVVTFWLTGCSFENLRAWVEGGRPAIALIWYKPLSDAGYSYYKGSFTHFVVIVGADEYNVVIHDPYYPDESGAYVTIPKDVFMDAWNNIPLEYGHPGGAILPMDALGGGEMNEPGNYKVTASWLNVRSGPGVNYPATGGLGEGRVVVIDKISNGWGHHPTGWSSMDYLLEVPTPPSGDLVVKVKVTGQHIDIDLPDGVKVENL